jgi:hypothetical protein
MKSPCARAAIEELAAAGIRDVAVVHRGKHPKVVFRVDGRSHRITVSTSPSDRNAPKNARRRRASNSAEANMAMSLKRIRAAPKALVKLGVLIDSGKRCPVTGQIMWRLNPNLTEERADSLV